MQLRDDQKNASVVELSTPCLCDGTVAMETGRVVVGGGSVGDCVPGIDAVCRHSERSSGRTCCQGWWASQHGQTRPSRKCVGVCVGVHVCGWMGMYMWAVCVSVCSQFDRAGYLMCCVCGGGGSCHVRLLECVPSCDVSPLSCTQKALKDESCIFLQMRNAWNGVMIALEYLPINTVV